MPDLEIPQGYILRTECEKAAFNNGFRRPQGEESGWSAWTSTTAQGTIFLAGGGPHGPWFLSLDHPGVIAELSRPEAVLPGPGLARYLFPTLTALHATLERVYHLAVALPDAPLTAFSRQTFNLPRSTEAERLVIERVGQNIFRDALMIYWHARCPITGITDPALLRASHIKPWKDCATDAERLDVHNGLLLSALWDAAFDRGLVTFTDDGAPLYAPTLSDAALAQLVSPPHFRLHLTAGHRRQMPWHRRHVFSQPQEEEPLESL